MSKKLFLLTSFALLAIATGSALAADTTFTGAVDGLWKTAGNWNPLLPDINWNDKAKINRIPGPTIDSTHTGLAAAGCGFVALADGSPANMFMTGGTLNVGKTADSWFIIAYGANDVGTFTLDGGTATTFDRMYVGFQGNGTLNMNGGTLSVGGTFGIGYNDASAITGRGTVNLTGGTIIVSEITGSGLQMNVPVGCVGKLNITGGMMKVKGDRRAVIQGYINDSSITAFNGLGDVIMSFDGTYTILTGVTNTTKARGPYPSNTASDAPPYAVLKWSPGDTAVTHDVYFGTDANSVRDANTSTPVIYKGSQPRDSNSYTPPALALGHGYFWRVDEVAEPNIYKGNVWQFVVTNYALIDDFEKYSDTTGLSAAWSNGGTGATLTFAAAGGHDKAKRMQVAYNNASTPLYSEAQTGSPTANWTVGGVVAMDIWYLGNAGNAAVPMYAALEDNDSHPVAVLVNSEPAAAQTTVWTVWHVKLSDFSGVNLANVKKLYIGFGDRNNPVAGGAGTVYIDDIRLYPSRCLNAPLEDLNSDCVVNLADFAIMASNWMQISII